MYCSHATHFKLRSKAYNEFANCFELQKGGNDLHIYDKKYVNIYNIHIREGENVIESFDYCTRY